MVTEPDHLLCLSKARDMLLYCCIMNVRTCILHGRSLQIILLSKLSLVKTTALRVWSCYCFVVQQKSSISFARLLLLELVIYYNFGGETDLGNRRVQMND